jgi:hypothetical protein
MLWSKRLAWQIEIDEAAKKDLATSGNTDWVTSESSPVLKMID